MRFMPRMIGLSLLLGIATLPLRAEENWAQWRGPHFNGSTEAKNLPDKIAKEDALWSTQMPGHSNGTPIVWGDRVFTTAQQKDGKLVAIALSKADGKILWQKDISDVSANTGRNDSATPSPVTDGKKVIFLYGTGDLAAFDFDGKPLWKRNLQKDHGRWNYMWHYGASPLLYQGKLYVPVLHRDVNENARGGARAGGSLADSYLLAINPETGADLWKAIRPNEARAESKESYATPIPWERPTGNQIVLAGGDCITGHDPETGKEIWRAGGWNPQKIPHWRLVPSVVTAEGLVFACPPKGGPVLAFKEGGSGEVTQSHLAWKGEGLTSDVCVPLVYKGNLYVLDGDKKQLACVDPKTGQKKWAGTLDSRNAVLRSSPTGADGKIYTMNENGDLFVCSADKFEVLSKAALGGGNGTSRGSIAAVDGMILVRTGDKVWAFAKK
jgi:outer membrane protein assembly factor BamB